MGLKGRILLYSNRVYISFFKRRCVETELKTEACRNSGETQFYHLPNCSPKYCRYFIMTSIRPFQATDLLDLNSVNLDCLTENYNIQFYLVYLIQWPSLFFKAVAPNGETQGYMMGKTEGKGTDWHTHITAVTVNPSYRRLGLASELCQHLQKSTEAEEPYHTYFIDLFVRVTNKLAITLYEKLGYSVYRRVLGYYGHGSQGGGKVDDENDAFDMRKSLKRDVNNETVRPDGAKHHVLPHEIVF